MRRNPYYERFRGKGQVHLNRNPSRSALRPHAAARSADVQGQDRCASRNLLRPSLYRGKLLLTVHDLAFLHVPDSFSAFDRIKDRLLVPFYLKKAEAVFTVSDYSRRDIVNTYRLPYERVCVSYNGVDPSFSPAEDRSQRDGYLRDTVFRDDRGTFSSWAASTRERTSLHW